MADDVQVLIEPAGGGEGDLTVERVRAVAAGHPRVAELLGDPPPDRLLVAGPGLALAVLRRDPRFEPLAGRDDVVVYASMPPLADLEREDGTLLRRPTLGILDPAGSPRHRIVAVDVAGGTVDW
jgi:hypothetical protein